MTPADDASAADDAYVVAARLLTERESETDSRRRDELRDHAIEMCLPLADHVAARFTGRGEPFDDLVQVARIGLVNACDRYDPEYGAAFLSFAVPTVMGEVRRYFRDSSWSLRVGRRAKENAQAISGGIDDLIQSLGRSPRPSELADHLGLSVDDVVEGLLARSAHSASSLDAPVGYGDDPGQPIGETLGDTDPELELTADFVAIKEAMTELPERERRIVALRFFRAMSQSEIAAEMGISQMHVSRLLSSTLTTLRDAINPI